ncbi:MAG: hypothetical protein ICV77_01410 [Cyanobacteria bacterium Co-bin8]|nr:hypothetical protein [Cyanobacteria bacterium Co-bin8]
MRSLILQSVFLTGLLALAACGGAETPTVTAPVTDSVEAPASSTEAPASSQPSPDDHTAATKGGQVVETGKYHMELVPVTEADGIHLDLYLQTGDTHEAVTDATVVAQVQLPDGTQQEVPMDYDAPGEHFFAFLPTQAAGEYKVVVQTDVQGEKVNGRFNFSK